MRAPAHCRTGLATLSSGPWAGAYGLKVGTARDGTTRRQAQAHRNAQHAHTRRATVHARDTARRRGTHASERGTRCECECVCVCVQPAACMHVCTACSRAGRHGRSSANHRRGALGSLAMPLGPLRVAADRTVPDGATVLSARAARGVHRKDTARRHCTLSSVPRRCAIRAHRGGAPHHRSESPGLCGGYGVGASSTCGHTARGPRRRSCHDTRNLPSRSREQGSTRAGRACKWEGGRGGGPTLRLVPPEPARVRPCPWPTVRPAK